MEVRAPFSFFPAIVWALLIDALDLVSNAFTIPLIALFGSGLGVDFLFDVLQAFIAFIIFDDWRLLVLNADYILPPVFDIFPSYTFYVIMEEGELI